MLIQSSSGRETFRTGSANYTTSVLSSRQFPLSRPVVPLEVASRSGDYNIQRLSSQTLPAAGGLLTDMGSWTQSSFELPEGMILLIEGNLRRSGAAYGASTTTTHHGMMIVQLRAGAALRRITFQQVGDPKATVEGVSVEGRFDHLTVAEAIQRGVKVGMPMMKALSYKRMDALFHEATLDQETQARVEQATETIRTGDDEAVQVTVPRRRRALDLGD